MENFSNGANLDRIQIIKGWLDGKGKTREKVYDVAWSDDRQPDANGKLPPVGNTVDLEAASWSDSSGARLHFTYLVFALSAKQNDPGLLFSVQLYFKDQGGIGRDPIRSLLTVCQFRWDQEYENTALRHQLDAFSPAFNDATEAEFDWFIGIIRAIKHHAIQEHSTVMHGNFAACLWCPALPQ